MEGCLTPARGGKPTSCASPVPASIVTAEVNRLRDELDEMYAQLQAKEETLSLSASYGKKLVEANTDLESRLATLTEESSIQIEDLQQENHDLRVKLDNTSRSIMATADLESENQALKEALTASRVANDNTTRKLEKELRESTEKVGKLEGELKKFQLLEEQLRTQLKTQEIALHDLESEALAAAHSAEQSEAFTEAKATIVRLQTERLQLQSERDELHNQNAQLALQCDTLSDRLETETSARANSEERCSEATSSNRELKSRCTKLQDELALTVAKLEGGGRREGTDLYSEVDDKRRALEKEGITLRQKIATLRKAVDLGDHQRRQLRNQVQMLSQMRGNRADTSKMRRLEQALSQSRSEVMQLGAKCVELERQRSDHFSKMRAHHDTYSDFGDKRTYVEYLQEEVEQGKRTLQQKDSELQTAVLQQMSESSKLRECERQLHKAEHRVEVLTTETMNLQMRIEDLQIMAVANAAPRPPVLTPSPENTVKKENAVALVVEGKKDIEVDTTDTDLGDACDDVNLGDTCDDANSTEIDETNDDSTNLSTEIDADSITEKSFNAETTVSPRRPLRENNRSRAKPAVEITVGSDQINSAGECAQQ